MHQLHFLLTIFYSLFGNHIGDKLEGICEAECIFNQSLPELRTNFCVPLAAMARSSRTTAFVAKSILVMLGSNGSKLINVFDLVLFPRLQDDDEDIKDNRCF